MLQKQSEIDPELLKIISPNTSSMPGDSDNSNTNKNENKIILNNKISYDDILNINRIREINKINNIDYNSLNRPKDPVTQKIIKALKMKEKELIKELSKLANNEKLVKDQQYLLLINSNPSNIYLDKMKIKEELKQLKENKNGCLIRLDETKSRISDLEFKYEKNQGIYERERQEKLNKLLDRQSKIMNQSSDEVNIRIKKLQNENKKRLNIMQKDLENKLLERENKFKENLNKEKENKINILKKIRNEERKEILKRKIKGNEETKKLIEYVNRKPIIPKYLYQKLDNDFNEKANNRLLRENNKRKNFMKPMEYDLNDMLKNYQEYKNKRNLELQEKTQKLKKSWSERSLLIPSYKTQLRHMIDNEEKNLKLEKENEKAKIKEMKNNQKKYSKKIENQQIFNMKQFIFNERQKIKNNKDDYILRNKINNKHNLVNNNLNIYCDLIREKLFLKNNNKSQDNFKQDISNNNNDLGSQEINKSEKDNKSNIIKLPNLNQKKIANLKQSMLNQNSISPKSKNNKKINDSIKSRNISKIKKTKKSQTIEIEDIDYKGTKEIQNLIEKNGLDKSTFEIANCKLESLNEKKKRKSLLLKHEGGFIKNPGLGEELCDILIDSMTAKLSLINEIDKVQNKNKPEMVDIGIGPGSGGIKKINSLNVNDDIEENEQTESNLSNEEE